MTALLRTPTSVLNHASDATSIMEGSGVDLFTSGSIETTGEMTTGNGVQMFTTSCVTAGSSDATGDKVELFTTSC